MPRRERPEAAYDLFPILAERKGQNGPSMSGGQQQLLAIGRALMACPRLVIFDEISLGLAPVVIDKLYEALALADHAYVLEHGVIALSGTPRQIAADPRAAEDTATGEVAGAC